MWSYKEVVAQTGFRKTGSNVHFQKRILAYRMSEVVPAKLILLVSLTGIFPTAYVFEYNSSVLSPSMTLHTELINGQSRFCVEWEGGALLVVLVSLETQSIGALFVWTYRASP